MSKVALTHEIRFKVSREMYDSLEASANRCSQPVGVFSRQLLGVAFVEFQQNHPQFFYSDKGDSKK